MMERINLNSLQMVNNSNKTVGQVSRTPGEAQQQFKTALNEALSHVNDVQKASGEMTRNLAKGEVENLHDVMVAGQKSSITLQATIEVRNKVIEAYQEIMRMQV